MNGLELAVSPETLTHFMLIVARLGGAIMVAPFFGHVGLPMQVRIGLAIAIALPLAGQAPMSAAVNVDNTWSLAGLLIVEVATGLMFGLVPQFIFGGVLLGGQLAGIHMGLGLARIVDPLTNVDATPVAFLFQFITMLVFLALDAHHLILRALAQSFTIAPVGALHLGAAGIGDFLGRGVEIFEIAVRIAAPILGGLLVIDTAMGLLARAIKELNVFIMGFAVKIGVGLLLLGTALPYAVRFLEQRFSDLEPSLVGLLGAFN